MLHKRLIKLYTVQGSFLCNELISQNFGSVHDNYLYEYKNMGHKSNCVIGLHNWLGIQIENLFAPDW